MLGWHIVAVIAIFIKLAPPALNFLTTQSTPVTVERAK